MSNRRLKRKADRYIHKAGITPQYLFHKMGSMELYHLFITCRNTAAVSRMVSKLPDIKKAQIARMLAIRAEKLYFAPKRKYNLKPVIKRSLEHEMARAMAFKIDAEDFVAEVMALRKYKLSPKRIRSRWNKLASVISLYITLADTAPSVSSLPVNPLKIKIPKLTSKR